MLDKKLFVERLKSEGFAKTAERVMKDEGEDAQKARAETPDLYTPKTDKLIK